MNKWHALRKFLLKKTKTKKNEGKKEAEKKIFKRAAALWAYSKSSQ